MPHKNSRVILQPVTTQKDIPLPTQPLRSELCYYTQKENQLKEYVI